MRIPRNYNDLPLEMKTSDYSTDTHQQFYAVYDAYFEKKKIIDDLMRDCEKLGDQLKECRKAELVSLWERQIGEFKSNLQPIVHLFQWEKADKQYQEVVAALNDKKPNLGQAMTVFKEIAQFIITKGKAMETRFAPLIENVKSILQQQRENVIVVYRKTLEERQKPKEIERLTSELKTAKDQIASMEKKMLEMKQEIERMQSQTASQPTYSLGIFSGTPGY